MTLDAREFELVLSAIDARDDVDSEFINDKLGAPKTMDEIIDAFSSVLGDAFHYMDRAKVPFQHDAKKSYFVSLTVRGHQNDIVLVACAA